MRTKLFLGAALMCAASTLASAPAQAQARPPAPLILVVDTARVARECTACVAATAALQAQDTSLRQRQQALTTPIQTEEQAITQALEAAGRLTGTARTNAETALRPRIDAFNQRRQAAAQELQTLQQNLQSTQLNVSRQISGRLATIFTQVMTARGANLVLPVEGRLAHSPALEVTNEVLAALNQQLPSVSITPLPQQQQPAQPQR
jgi:Skp family chaperone for outer membrane proteins